MNERVSAIVPAYNEGERIEPVLKALSNTKSIEEIIVIDDGSSDNTEDVLKKYPQIKYLKNEVNMGKAYSMDRGVKEAKSEVIFFCDADLVGLTSEDVEKIINPVLKKECDMSIGIRGNVSQKTVKFIAILSGERAIRKEIWENLPKYYKHRYRIETGLNMYIKKGGGKVCNSFFDYRQTLKESKYGFIRGELLRWWMNLDVCVAYLRAYFEKFPEIKSK